MNVVMACKRHNPASSFTCPACCITLDANCDLQIAEYATYLPLNRVLQTAEAPFHQKLQFPICLFHWHALFLARLTPLPPTKVSFYRVSSVISHKNTLKICLHWSTMSLEGLLPFHRTILEDIHDPSNSQLVLLARGLGLRKIVCTLMQIYDQSTNLVLLVNASSEEEAAIGEELGIMGCRKPGLRTVSYEMGKQDRWVILFVSHVQHQSSPTVS